MKRLNVLLTGAKGENRQRLRECLRSCSHRISVLCAPSLQEVTKIVSKERALDFLMLGGGSISARAKIAQELSAEHGSRCPPMIAVLSAGEMHAVGVADTIKSGFTAMVVEPPSVQGVNEAVNTLLASKAYQSYREARDRATLGLLFACGSSMIDQRALDLRQGRDSTVDAHREWKRLHSHLCGEGYEIDENHHVQLLEAALESAAPFAERSDRGKKHLVHAAKVVTQVMTARNITPERLAQAMHMNLDELQRFLDEKAEMSSDLAEKLGRVLGHDKSYWMGFRS